MSERFVTLFEQKAFLTTILNESTFLQRGFSREKRAAKSILSQYLTTSKKALLLFSWYCIREQLLAGPPFSHKTAPESGESYWDGVAAFGEGLRRFHEVSCLEKL